MQYFVLSKDTRENQFIQGQPNPIYTEVLPDQGFATAGYWLWLKSASAHGFDVKAFDQQYVYIRSTELTWTDHTTFKRFVHDLPIAACCVPASSAGPQIQVPDTTFQCFASCSSYKSSKLGTSLNDLDAPSLIDTRGQHRSGNDAGSALSIQLRFELPKLRGRRAVLPGQGIWAMEVGTLPTRSSRQLQPDQ